uniref:Reverse transcriptase domain-containing protein n=1 Tax=Loa loa TaxID=7209 RepID=A0A1I7W3Y3_LOALO
MGVIPDDIMKRGDFYEINDFISTVLVLHGEYNRKLELQHITGGGFRPDLRSMKGRKVLPTFLASYAREQKCGPTMIKVLIDRHFADLRAYQRARLQNIEKNLEQNNIVEQVKACNDILAFTSSHKHWVHARKHMSNYAALQHKIRKTVPFKRSSATRLIVLKDVTVSDLCNELIDYPIWAGFHYYFMRVLNKNGLHIVYDDIHYAVQEGNKLRHLRIMPSKYSYKPQATTVFGETKVYSKGQIPLDHWPLNDYPPSIESVSGFSTVTKMSTATTSPNSWQNDWKMQPRHDEYDHRLTETTIPDVRDTRARGDEEFAIRFNKELSKRIDFALADIETVLSTTMLNYKMDPRVVAACDIETFPAILDRHGDMTWLEKVESYISSILIKDNPTDEEKKDLKVLYYAKQRYEQILSKYDRYPVTKPTDNPQQNNEEALSFGILQSDHTTATHLYINDSWRRIIDSNCIPPNALQILKLLITDRDAWLLDSDFSNLGLVDRADRISIPRVIEVFHHHPVDNISFFKIPKDISTKLKLKTKKFIYVK